MDTSIVTQSGFVELYVLPWAIRIVVAVAIWFIGKWAAKKLTTLSRSLMTRANMDVTLVQFLGNIVYTILLGVVIIAALDQLGIPTTSMLAVFGAAGLAIGLALKDSLGNFASGVMLILFRPFKVGDQIEAGSINGIVEEIRIFSTLMRTADNRGIIVPNGSIANGVIINYNAKPNRRIDLVFGIGYGDDLRHAKSIIEDILRSDDLILSDPAPAIAVSDLAENSVNLTVNAWAKTGDYGTARAALLEKVKLAFDNAGISIPYPQRDVHVYSVSGNTPPSDAAESKAA